MMEWWNIQNPPSTFASGGQKPFREKVSGLPKAFHWYGLDTLFFFVSLRVTLWLKIFWLRP
jgi:hypothetical protein